MRITERAQGRGGVDDRVIPAAIGGLAPEQREPGTPERSPIDARRREHARDQPGREHARGVPTTRPGPVLVLSGAQVVERGREAGGVALGRESSEQPRDLGGGVDARAQPIRRAATHDRREATARAIEVALDQAVEARLELLAGRPGCGQALDHQRAVGRGRPVPALVLPQALARARPQVVRDRGVALGRQDQPPIGHVAVGDPLDVAGPARLDLEDRGDRQRTKLARAHVDLALSLRSASRIIAAARRPEATAATMP